MKHWAETRQVFDWLGSLAAEQRPGALCTVVDVRGSAYRREGAKLAVALDGASVGNVSGGCLEGDVREVARQVAADGIPQLRSYCSGVDQVNAWDLGVGCEGEVTVYIEPAPRISMLELQLLAGAAPFAICREVVAGADAKPWCRLVVTAQGCDGTLGQGSLDIVVADRASHLVSDGQPSCLADVDGHQIFIETFFPPPQLLICGAGNDARPLARIGREVGMRVAIVDRRPGLLAPDRFPEDAVLIECDAATLTMRTVVDDNTYGVVMNHNFADDAQYLRALARTDAPYIGMLGPRQRTERIVASILADLCFDTDRVYGPVGLDIGTDGAEQVALAIIAEILAVRGGRIPASLRERQVAIHRAEGG